jgi:4-hydroxy-3-polyprenylbenzoate decarboxylase/2,5-furandicarboxylate decarboxylase 1
MPFQDMREYLNLLEEKKELVRIRDEIDPKFGIAAYIRKTSDIQGPALLFERVKGSSMPVVGGLYATTKRLLIGLGVERHQDAVSLLINAMKNPINSEFVDSGPCQEVVYRGDEVDLTRLPVPTYSSKDGGPFLTMGILFCCDPDTGTRNLGIYRMQLKGKNKLGLNAQSMALQMARADAKNIRLPIAIAMGNSPELLVGSQWMAPYGTDELGLAGALQGSPIKMVKCLTNDLEVPATSEIVIEGAILPNQKEIEGPFGEFTGYYQPAQMKPLIEVTAITHRRDPIYLAGMTGMPTTDNHVLKQIPIEASYYEALKPRFPEIKAVHIPNCAGAHYLMIVSMGKRLPVESRSLIAAAFGLMGPKFVIIVDEDVDVYNLEAVLWAVSMRSQPDQDVIIMPRMYGAPLDPSGPSLRTSALMGIDATVSGAKFPDLIEVPGVDQVPDVSEWGK